MEHINDAFAYFNPNGRPIPLTEEWLLKFGLEKEWKDEYEFAEGRLIQIEKRFYYEVSGNFDSVIVGNELKYVHQLQNLYFAIKGEELTIK